MKLNKYRKQYSSALLALLLAGFSSQAAAGWWNGRVDYLYHAYDGTTVAFKLSGWQRTNCTCYSDWPDMMCLDRTKVSIKEQIAALMMAKSMNKTVTVNIDETTCKVLALGLDP